MSGGQKHVVISLSECEEDHFLPLINLGESLLHKGIAVTFLVCAHGPCPGSGNIFCEIFDSHCAKHRARIVAELQNRRLEYVSTLEGVSDEKIAASMAKADPLDFYCYQSAEYQGYNLWDIAKGTICRYLQKTAITPHDHPVIKRFFSTAILYLDTLPGLYSNLRPDILILFNGMPLLERVMREVAATYDIQVFAEENSCFADRKFLDPTGVVVNRHQFAAPATWELIRQRTLDNGQLTRLTEYLDDVFAGRVNTISQCAADSQSEVRSRLGFTPGQPLAIVLCQVPFDSVIVNDSPLYSDIIDFICDVIDIFARKPEWGVIVRLHPLEERLYGNSTLKRLEAGSPPGNFRIVHGSQLNTYALMDCCQFGLTINSQSGLEMLSKHKPVIVAGNAFYGKKGFTADVYSRQDLVAAVDLLCDNPQFHEAQRKLSDLFLYCFIFEYLIPYDRSTKRFGDEACELILSALTRITTSRCPPNGRFRGGNTSQRVMELYAQGIKKAEHKEYSEALDCFKSADALVMAKGKPEERIELLMQQGEILLHLKRPDDTETVSGQLAEIAGSIKYDFSLLHDFLRIKALNAGERLCRKHLEMHPDDHGCRFELALILEKKQQWREVWEQLHALLSQNPGHIDTLFHFERNRKRAGFPKDDNQLLRFFSKASPSAYAGSILDSFHKGNVVEALKRVFILVWLFYKRLVIFGKELF